MLQRVLSRLSISCRRFFVSACRNFSQVNPSVLCFRKFSVAKKFMDKSGGVSRFSVEHFLLHSAENFRRGEHFSVSLISGMENVWVRGGYQKFPSKIICLTVSTVLVKEPFGVSLNSGTENVYASEGYVTTFVFLSKTFVS